MCYHAQHWSAMTQNTRLNASEFKELEMSETIKKVRPVVEATIISLVLVIAALAVPAIILYTAV